MAKRIGKRSTGRAPRPDDRQMFHVDAPSTPSQPAHNAAHDATISDAQRHEQAATERRECRRRLERSTELGTIIEAWRKAQEMGEAAGLGRESMRRIDMHVALADPTVLDRMRRADKDARSLLETLDYETQGSVREPDFQQLLPEGETGFDALREFSVQKGYEVVEQGANKRTEREHRGIRLSVEIALRTENISDFLYVLDTHLADRELTHKLTRLEIARLNDQLRHILESRDWPHPTQEMARSFTMWEKVLGDARHDRYTYMPEKARFQKEPQAAPTTKALRRTTPSFWENVMNAPSDIAKMIFDEDGARTGEGKKKE